MALLTVRVEAVAHDEHDPAPWRTRLADGLRYVRADRRLRTLLGGQAVIFVLLTMITPIEVIYAKETLDTGDTGFGLLLASWGVGMVLGSVVFARESARPIAVLIGASTLAMGFAYLGMAAAPGLALACVASAFGGIGNGVQWIAVVTALQEATADRFQARVAGLLEAVNTLAPGIGFLLGGTLTALMTPRAAFAVSGAGTLVVLAAAALLLRGARTRLAEPASGEASPSVGYT